MNRKYTIETYLERVERLKSFRPDIAITTDIIVGFPGEEEDDFQATMDVLEKVRYHGAFSFKYSDRPNAQAAEFRDKVAEEIKTERLKRLQDRQDEITLTRNREYVGKTLDVMVEGQSKTAGDQWSGRSAYNHIVNFISDTPLAIGAMRFVKITEGLKNSLRGELVSL
jgi:tRNA-2-methylthio-N6-dimethylallyladenosine synthase